MMRAKTDAFIAWSAVALAAVLLVAGRDWAQDEVNVQLHDFHDTRSVSVLSPTVDLSKDFTDRTNLRANFGVDAISAASDSCVRCHHDGATNRRGVAGLGVIEKLGALKLALGGSYSQERFYRATTFVTSLSRDLAQANTTVAAGYTFSFNQPMLHPLKQYENQYQNDVFLSVTQTLSKVTIGQLGYQLEAISGFQDNPFLRTSVNGLMTIGHVPDYRLRHTLSARIRQALPADTFLEADYRRYFDDWQLHSNTLGLGVSHHFSPVVLGYLSYRRYDQSGAYFYQPVYVGTPQYFTADFRLEPFASGLYTGQIVLTPRGSWLGLPSSSEVMLQYERYRANNGFESAIVSGGVRIPLGGHK